MKTDGLKMMKTHCRLFSASEQKYWSPFIFQILFPLYIKNRDEENHIIHLLIVKPNLQVPAPYINRAFPNPRLGTLPSWIPYVPGCIHWENLPLVNHSRYYISLLCWDPLKLLFRIKYFDHSHLVLFTQAETCWGFQNLYCHFLEKL